MNLELAKVAGLQSVGHDDEGDALYLGTDKQWQKYAELERLWEERGKTPIEGSKQYEEDNL